jgi:hypothetical protein
MSIRSGAKRETCALFPNHNLSVQLSEMPTTLGDAKGRQKFYRPFHQLPFANRPTVNNRAQVRSLKAGHFCGNEGSWKVSEHIVIILPSNKDTLRP